MTDTPLAARLRAAALTFTQDRGLKNEAADHINRLEDLLRQGLGHNKHTAEYRALCERALEI